MPLLKTLKKQAKKAISPKAIGKRIELSMKEKGRIREEARKAALREREKQAIRVAVAKERIKAKRKIKAFKHPRFVIEGQDRVAPTRKRKKKKKKRKIKTVAEQPQQMQRKDIDWLMRI